MVSEPVAYLLGELDAVGRSRIAGELAADVLGLHATEDARARRPTPLDEVENCLDVFRRSLLDVTPRAARDGLERTRKLKPDPFFASDVPSRIRTGGFDEHLQDIADADWIVEAIVERADVKRARQRPRSDDY